MNDGARFPTYSFAAQTGERGFTLVKGIVESDLGWLLRKNHQESDFGIDAYIDVVSEVGHVTGKSIAVQIKTGQSYLDKKSEHGWTYSGDIKHVNYYLNQDIPVVLILVDEGEKRAYWCLCDPLQMERRGETWTITVPFNSLLTKASKEELLKYVSPVRDYVSQLDAFWELNKALKSTGRIFFMIAREDVETLDLEPLFLAFKRLEVNPGLLAACKNRVDVVIDGYNDDPRELRDIPEVKKWVELVFRGIQGWAYYLTMDDQSQFIRVLQLFNMKYAVKKELEDRHLIEFDFSGSDQFLGLMYDNLNKFCDSHGISEAINKEVSFKLVEFLTGESLPDEVKDRYKDL